MKKFNFRLQKVMQVKEEVEKQKMLDLADAKRFVAEEEKRLGHLQSQDEAYRETIERRKTAERINPMEMDLYYRYLRKLGDEIDLQNGRVQDARDKMEKRRQVLLNASKERKVLEKLREKKYTAFRAEVTKKEQNFIDDVATVNHVRGKKEAL